MLACHEAVYRGLDPSSDEEGLERDAIITLAGEMAEQAYECIWEIASDQERKQLLMSRQVRRQ